MGHEVLLDGRILSTFSRAGWERGLYEANKAVVNRLPPKGDWPWLSRGMFSLPGGFPQGTCRSHIVHFGGTLKDDPADPSWWNQWLEKFESMLLWQMFWTSAVVHVETDFLTPRTFLCEPTESSLMAVFGNPLEPVVEWTRTFSPSPTAGAWTVDIENVPNIGATSGEWLRSVGITTAEELRVAGPLAAFLAVRETGVTTSLNLLWALVAGLRGEDWRTVSDEEKAEWLSRLDASG